MTDDDSDEALARRAKGGERAAFERLVARHEGPTFRLARRYLGSRDDALDIVQDSFVSAWLGLKRYDPTRRFEGWLRTIAINKCRDFSRRQTVRRLFLRSHDVVAASHASEAALECGQTGEQLTANRLARLDRAIAALPPAQKEPLILTTFAGLSHQDAAAQLGLTVKAVEMRLYRARRSLERALADPPREG